MIPHSMPFERPVFTTLVHVGSVAHVDLCCQLATPTGSAWWVGRACEDPEESSGHQEAAGRTEGMLVVIEPFN